MKLKNLANPPPPLLSVPEDKPPIIQAQPLAQPPARSSTTFTGWSEKPLWNLERDGLTKTVLERMLTCTEKHRLSMLEGLSTTRVSEPLAFGTLVHEALDKYYTELKHNKEPDLTEILGDIYFTDRYKLDQESIPDPNAFSALEERHGIAHTVIQAYIDYWRKDFSEREWIDLEREFNQPYFCEDGRKIPLRGKIDGVFRTNDHQLWLFETKTKSRIEEDSVVDKLHYDLQVMLYLFAMKLIYHEEPSGVLYNIIRKPQLRRKNAEPTRIFLQRIKDDIAARPDFYFIRNSVQIQPEDSRRWLDEFHRIVKHAQYIVDNDAYYRTSGACTDRVGVCEFFRICTRGDRDGYVTRKQVFPELSLGAA